MKEGIREIKRDKRDSVIETNRTKAGKKKKTTENKHRKNKVKMYKSD